MKLPDFVILSVFTAPEHQPRGFVQLTQRQGKHFDVLSFLVFK